MGRREAPITTSNQALAALAMWLRTVRADTGLTYEQLSSAAGYHPTTLQRAASGSRTPTRNVVTAYATACGAREDHAEQLWKEARYEARRLVRDRQTSLAAPRPELVRDFADFGAVLVELYDKAGAPPFRQMQERAGAFGLLPHSTAHRIVNKQAMPHSRPQFEAYLRACEVEGEDQKPWLEAWQRAWREHTGTTDDSGRALTSAALMRLHPSKQRLRASRTAALRSLKAAGYEPLPWRHNGPTVWRVRCTECQLPATIDMEETPIPRECSCKRRPKTLEHGTSPRTGAGSEDHPVEEALRRLELTRSRLRAPLLDQDQEQRAIDELRIALRHVYVAMAEHGRLESGLRSRAQDLLSRSTDLLAWVEAEAGPVPLAEPALDKSA